MSIRPEFPTPEMRAAEQELDFHISAGLAEARELEDTLDRLEKEESESDKNVDEDPAPLFSSEQLKSVITERAMTPAWGVVIERIDKGEFTWEEMLTNIRVGKADPEVVAAFQSLATIEPLSPEELQKYAPVAESADPPQGTSGR